MVGSRWVCLALISVLTLERLEVTYGWNMDGHMAIGQTAMSAIRANAVLQVKRLTRGKDVVDVAGWADKVRSKYPGCEVLHFQMGEEGKCDATVDPAANCDDGQCLVNALTHFHARLTGATVKEMKYPDGIAQLTDADALKYLINLIGDLHQPMHLGNRGDKSGKEFTVRHRRDPHSGGKPVSLYQLWDNDMIEHYRSVNSKFWDGGWTHINSLGKPFYVAEKKRWDSYDSNDKGKAFLDWAQESRKTFCDTIMKLPQNMGPLVNNTEINGATEHFWMEEAKRKILQAGVRTAIVLNSILEEREVAGRLRQGSGVDLQGLEDVHVDTVSGVPRWVKNAGINLSIILTVLLLFVYITKFYGGAPIPTGRSSKTSSPTNQGIRMKEMTD